MTGQRSGNSYAASAVGTGVGVDAGAVVGYGFGFGSGSGSGTGSGACSDVDIDIVIAAAFASSAVKKPGVFGKRRRMEGWAWAVAYAARWAVGHIVVDVLLAGWIGERAVA